MIFLIIICFFCLFVFQNNINFYSDFPVCLFVSHSNPKITVYWTCHSSHLDRIAHQIKFIKENPYSDIHPLFSADIDNLSNFIPVIKVTQTDLDNIYKKIRINRTPQNSLKREMAILSGLYKSMLYFINKTKDDWYLRLDDDAGIYPKNLLKAIKKLSISFTMQSPLLFGQFVRIGSLLFLGGGSGYLFNRKGVEIFLEQFDIFINSKKHHFDVNFHETLDRFGENYKIAHISGMTSEWNPSSFKQISQHIMEDQKLFNTTHWQIPNCPISVNNIEDTPFPVNDVFVYHHYWEGRDFNISFQTILDSHPPPQLFYYNCHNLCELCWNSHI